MVLMVSVLSIAIFTKVTASVKAEGFQANQLFIENNHHSPMVDPAGN